MKTRTFCHPFTSLIALGALVGCVGAPDALDAPAQQSQPLNGTVTFIDESCSASRQSKITSALSILRAQVVTSPSAITACVRDAILSPHEGAFAEEIVARLGEDIPTRVKCEDLEPGTNGHSDANDGTYEALTMDFDFLDGNSVERVAAVILHEVAHNKDYSHLGGADYDSSIPQQVEQCSGYLSGIYTDPNFGPARSSFQGEAELQRIGGSGGAPVEDRCSGSDFIMGQSVATSSSEITSLGFRCGTRGSSPSNRGMLFTSSGTASTDLCANDEVVVGVRGYADGGSSGTVHRVGFVCSRWSDVTAGTNTIRRALTERGTATGQDIERLCPAGMALKGLLGRADSSLHELRLVCQRTSRYTFGAYVDLATFGGTYTGGTDRNQVRELCSDAGVMVGLYARRNAEFPSFASRIHRLGALCHGTALTAITQQLTLRTSGEDHVTPAAGSLNSGFTAVESSCASGQALVGFQATTRSTNEVESVTGLCANVSDWANTSLPAPATTALSTLGTRVHTTVTSSTCARGQFLVGLDSSEVVNSSGDRMIESVTPVCRSIAISLL